MSAPEVTMFMGCFSPHQLRYFNRLVLFAGQTCVAGGQREQESESLG